MEEKKKHDPMRDNPAFAKANIEHRFTSENNPGKRGITIRNFMRQLAEMTEREVKDYISDETKPMLNRRIAEVFIAKKCKPREICEFVNQVEGMPTQPISNEEPPVVNINITTNADTTNK